MTWQEFAAETHAFFSAWLEDFADYAADAMSDAEAAERQAEYDQVQRLAAAAAEFADAAQN